MIKQAFMLATLPIAVGASASCLNDPPEYGDIGPASELVCDELERRFPSAALAVEGRSIRSPSEVSVLASVDGAAVLMRYRLEGYAWRLDDAPAPEVGLSMRP